MAVSEAAGVSVRKLLVDAIAVPEELSAVACTV
jgi:type II secretory pathway component PulL